MDHKVSIEAGAYLLLALLIFLMPLRWLLAALTAAAVHELCHILAIHFCGGQVLDIQIGPGGAVIRTEPMNCAKELLCALAGPVGGFSLLLFARWLPRTAICAGFQSVYNLLPLYPLDGGRALHCFASMAFSPVTAERLCAVVQTGCLCAVVALGLYGTFRLHLGLLPILAAVLLLRKIPCKLGSQRLQ